MKRPRNGKAISGNLINTLMLFVASAMMLTLALYGESNPSANLKNDGSLQKVLKAGQLVLGFDRDFPPMSFTNEKGEIVGFDIDLALEICRRLGITLVKRPIIWATWENMLYNGTIDCLSSVMATSARSSVMSISEPYIKNSLLLVVPANSSVRDLRDLKGKTIGAQEGSTTQKLITESPICKDVQVALFDYNQEIMQALKQGKLDAGLLDSVTVYYFLYSGSEQFFILSESLSEEAFTLGFRKSDLDLRNGVQKIISDMNADGTLARISQKWFGIDITIVR